MKYSTFSLMIGILLCSAVLPACEQKKNTAAKKDVSQFVKRIEEAAKAGEIGKLKKPVEIVHITYDGSDLRDPFELPTMVKNARQYPNAILRETALDSLKLVGVVLHKDERWAIIRSNDGKIYKITEGMRVGLQQALLTQISQGEIKFSIDDSGTDEGKRDVVMTVQEPKQ